MANTILSLTASSPMFDEVVVLDGVEFILSFTWNARASSWFCEIRDSTDTVLAEARKVAVDIPFIAHGTVSGLPEGQLWFFTTDGLGGQPGLFDLGARVQLEYVAKDNVS